MMKTKSTALSDSQFLVHTYIGPMVTEAEKFCLNFLDETW